jgi:hypothetical protein
MFHPIIASALVSERTREAAARRDAVRPPSRPPGRPRARPSLPLLRLSRARG